MDKAYVSDAFMRMTRIREFDLLVHEYAQRDYRVMALMHSAIGAEAYSVAAMMNLTEDDYMATTYRNHAHSIAKGIDLNSLAAELCGKAAGCCRGKGGNMHAIDQDINIIAGFGIIGAGLPSCLGTAFAAKYKNQNNVTVGFCGDGAVAQGAFHESLNLASIWKLPVLFVLDNNRYAMSTATEANLVTEDIVQYARAYNMPAVIVDGMDFFAVDAAVKTAMSYIRAGKGPYFIECKAYRYHGQFEGDKQLYKPQDEVDYYLTRDPLRLFSEEALKRGLLDEEEMTAIRKKAKKDVLAAFDYADGCAFPEEKELYTHVYADVY